MLVVNPNPCFDRTLWVAELTVGTVSRPRRAEVTAGGKGLNVVRALRDLGAAGTLLGLLPADGAERLVALLRDEGLSLVGVPVAGAVRSATIVVEDSGRATVLNEPGPTLDAGDLEHLLATAASELTAGHRALACSGSLPPGLPVDAYARLVAVARANGVVSIVDGARDALAAALPAGPDLVTPNLDEAEGLATGRAVEQVAAGPADVHSIPDRARTAAGMLRERGARRALVTAGEHGAAYADGAGRPLAGRTGRPRRQPDRRRRRPGRRRAGLPGGVGSAQRCPVGIGVDRRGAARGRGGERSRRAPGRRSPRSRPCAGAVRRGGRTVNRRPTVHDVAARAGVSIKTVSRVVNGSASVSDEVRVRVHAAVEELHYVPNSWARSLKVGTGDTIGVVIDTIGDPFFAALTSAVEARALEAGLNVVFGSTGFDPARERRQVERMAMQQVRALLLAPVTGDHGYLLPYRRSFPTVLVDRTIVGGGYDTVLVDDHGATRRAVEHLLGHGHRRIAFIGEDARFPTTTQRLAGYHDAMAAAGIDPLPAWVPLARAEVDDAEQATRALLTGVEEDQSVTALLAANPRAGMGVVHALHSLERTDVAMVSFGDFALARTLRPGVTVVDQDPHRIGITATDRLLRLLDAKTGGTGEELIVHTDLIARGSGELRPVVTAR